jgi:transcriptional regulator with XRE-family HTH domain
MQGNKRLREELTQRGMKPSELAKSIGMDRGKVRKILRGAEETRLVDVARVAKALGFKVDLVFDQTTVLDTIAGRRRRKKAQVQWV